MEARDYIETGILELYVYGQLSADDNLEVVKMARQHPEIAAEIAAIENAMISLSSGFAPSLPAGNYFRIQEKLKLKQARKRGIGASALIGWTLAMLFLAAAAYLFYERTERNMQIVNLETEQEKLKDSIITLDTRNKRTETALGIVRDNNNRIVFLGGQRISPEASAKIYWNMQNQAVFVDAISLPEPPEGMVYQVWAINYRPFRPVSIGLLDDFSSNQAKIFSVENAESANAFGITLENAGGSESPTLEQLYVIGKI